MSIEAMKQALAALETCRIRSVSEWEVSDVTPKNVTAAISALRTAITQAEAQQPATPEPVGEPFCFASVNKHGDVTSTHKRRDSWRTIPLYSHPAPGVPDDAKRLNWLNDTNKRFRMGWEVGQAPAGNVSIRTIITGGKSIRDAIDAAMLAATQAQKGGE